MCIRLSGEASCIFSARMCQAEGKTRRKGMMDGKIEREKKRCVGERNEGKEGIKKGQGHMEPKPFNPPHTTDWYA